MKLLVLSLLCGLLSACAAIEAENSSPDAIPPKPPSPFDGPDASGGSISY